MRRSASSSSSAAKAKHSRHARVMRAARIEEGPKGSGRVSESISTTAAYSFLRERRCYEDGLCPRHATVRGVGIRCKAGFCAGGTRERRGRRATLGGADARGRTAARRTAKRHGSGWRTAGLQGAGRLAMGAWTVARLAEASIRQGGCNFASRDGVAGRMRQSRHAICAAPSHRGTSQLRPLSLRDALY